MTVILAFHVACSKNAIELPLGNRIYSPLESGVAFCCAPCYRHPGGIVAISVIISVCPTWVTKYGFTVLNLLDPSVMVLDYR